MLRFLCQQLFKDKRIPWRFASCSICIIVVVVCPLAWYISWWKSTSGTSVVRSPYTSMAAQGSGDTRQFYHHICPKLTGDPLMLELDHHICLKFAGGLLMLEHDHHLCHKLASGLLMAELDHHSCLKLAGGLLMSELDHRMFQTRWWSPHV